MTIDLNNWHRAIHQVTGAMALRFNDGGGGGAESRRTENYLRNHTLLIRSMRDVDFLPVDRQSWSRRVSIRIDVAEDVPIPEATRLLSEAAWRERHALTDAAYDRAVAILGLNGVADSLGAAAVHEPVRPAVVVCYSERAATGGLLHNVARLIF